MPNLSLRRLTDLLNGLIEQCSTILPPDASTLDDAAIKQRIDDWFLSNSLTPTLTEAALQCDQHGLVGAAKQLRDDSAELVQRQTDILFSDMARHWTAEELAFYRHKYGPFPMPLADESINEEVQRDRRMVLIGRVHALGKYARSLARSIETSGKQQADQAKSSCGMSHDPTRQDYEQEMQQIAQAVGDKNAANILAIAKNGDLTADRKMEQILLLDARFAGKDSNDWATLLSVSPAAIRQTNTWKMLHRTDA